MRYGVLLLSIAMLAACGDGPAGTDDGPLSLAVIRGDSQVVQAGSGQLPEPVVGRLVRLPSGSVAWSPLDLLVRPAYAQTVVQGSPVPGAVVCAVPLTDGGPEPFVPCTNTADDGTATFFFEAGIRTGTHITEIRGTVDQQPAVFDSVVTIIKPARPDTTGLGATCGAVDSYDSGDTLRLANMLHLKDVYDNDLAWHMETFGDSASLYVLADSGKTIVARPAVAGMDSVKFVGDNDFQRTGHVYIRWNQINPAAPKRWIVVLFLWPRDGGPGCESPWYPNPYRTP